MQVMYGRKMDTSNNRRTSCSRVPNSGPTSTPTQATTLVPLYVCASGNVVTTVATKIILSSTMEVVYKDDDFGN